MDERIKELIAMEIIKTLYAHSEKFLTDFVRDEKEPFREAFAQAFGGKLSENVSNSWIRNQWLVLNFSLEKSFYAKIARILCGGEKREFTIENESLKNSHKQQKAILEIITDLKNGERLPNVEEENGILQSTVGEADEDATEFTADVFYEDTSEVVCIEMKTLTPDNLFFRAEKEKVLEAKAALKNKYPNKEIKFYIGFPFDPLSSTPTGYDKERFMNYSVEFRKFVAVEEFLLASELWNFLSGVPSTMEMILEIINSIATMNFETEFQFLQEKHNLKTRPDEYSALLDKWHLRRERQLAENDSLLIEQVRHDKERMRIYNQNVFKEGSYNANRATELGMFLNTHN